MLHHDADLRVSNLFWIGDFLGNQHWHYRDRLKTQSELSVLPNNYAAKLWLSIVAIVAITPSSMHHACSKVRCRNCCRSQHVWCRTKSGIDSPTVCPRVDALSTDRAIARVRQRVPFATTQNHTRCLSLGHATPCARVIAAVVTTMLG